MTLWLMTKDRWPGELKVKCFLYSYHTVRSLETHHRCSKQSTSPYRDPDWRRETALKQQTLELGASKQWLRCHRPRAPARCLAPTHRRMARVTNYQSKRRQRHCMLLIRREQQTRERRMPRRRVCSMLTASSRRAVRPTFDECVTKQR